MSNIQFNTYYLDDHNPFDRFPEGKYIAAEADESGMYSIHIRFNNGLGLTSKEKMILHEAAGLLFTYRDELELPNSAVWVDLPNHVVDEPGIFNRMVKNMLKRKGMYWK